MRLLVKIGGAQLAEPASRDALATSIARARDDGHQIVLVHGGGDQIRELTGRLGIEDRYHDGLRVTDAATAEIVLMVLGGQVNRRLVEALGRRGVPAVGLTGADGGTFWAAPLRRAGVDLGFVGQVHAPSPALVEVLLEQGIVPVIATVAPLHPDLDGDDGHFYNINADHCAGPLAQAFEADAVLFLTNVPGVLDAAGKRFDALTPADCASLRKSGVIAGGMIPKVEAALMALEAHPEGQIKIAPAAGDDAVRAALTKGAGTSFRDASER